MDSMQASLEAEQHAKAEADNDSGLDSTTAGDDKECLINSDEIQEVRLNMRARNCKNVTTVRPKIPLRLCKVTKVQMKVMGTEKHLVLLHTP